MFKIEADDNGNAVILHDDETLQGNFFEIRLDDRNGLELVAKLCDFYEAKHYQPLKLLNAAAHHAKPGFWRSLFAFFGV